jgi:hypothetical protein
MPNHRVRKCNDEPFLRDSAQWLFSRFLIKWNSFGWDIVFDSHLFFSLYASFIIPSSLQILLFCFSTLRLTKCVGQFPLIGRRVTDLNMMLDILIYFIFITEITGFIISPSFYFFFFFLPLKLTETPLISLSSHLDEVKTMEHHSLDHFSSAMQSLLLLKMLSCLYLSASLYLSLIYPDLLFFSVYI